MPLSSISSSEAGSKHQVFQLWLDPVSPIVEIILAILAKYLWQVVIPIYNSRNFTMVYTKGYHQAEKDLSAIAEILLWFTPGSLNTGSTSYLQ